MSEKKPPEIRIGSFEDFKKFVKETMHEPHGKDVIFLEPEKLCTLLSPRRLELIRAVRKNPHAGVTQLAKALARKQEAVSRDLAILKNYGLVKTHKEAGAKTVPEVTAAYVTVRI